MATAALEYGMTIKELRTTLRSYYGGPRRYRIRKGGRVDVYAMMPGTNIIRWFPLGSLVGDDEKGWLIRPFVTSCRM